MVTQAAATVPAFGVRVRARQKDDLAVLGFAADA